MARRGRLTLGLYNSYDKTRFAEAHRRALARAGAVAAAFDCNLTTFGFPFHLIADDVDLSRPVDIAHHVASGTSIGAGGQYFLDLATAGRFHVEELPSKGLPPQYGRPVLATSRVTVGQGLSARELASDLAAGRSILLLIGLGPHGFPKALQKVVPDHWDLTGRAMSLETCTALSAGPAILATHLEHLADGPDAARHHK